MLSRMTAADLPPKNIFDRQARVEELYAKCTFGAGVLFLVVEIAYFGAWKHPSLSVPTWDAIDAVIGRDFLNIWMGARRTCRRASGLVRRRDPGTPRTEPS